MVYIEVKRGVKSKGKHPFNALSDRRVRTEKRTGMHADGNGLYLRVDPSGAKRWVQRIVVRGKRRNLGLGGFPLVSLREAREKALTNRKLAREDGDPFEEKNRRSIPTFAEAARQVIDFHRPTWSNAKHIYQWEMTLSAYVFPKIGGRRVNQVTGEDVLSTLTPIWTTKPETARRVKQRISAIMDWAVANGYRTDNPAGKAMTQVLPRRGRITTHHRTVPYSEVERVLHLVRESNAAPVTKLSFEFLVLTAARSGEVREAKWEEVDFVSKTWIVPGGRMKAGREHRVPLSERAVEILKEAKRLYKGSDLVFPAPRSGGALSDMTHRNLLRKLGVDAVPHGFRSSFRDWAAERTDTPHAVMETALAHVVANSTEAAYARSDLFERRRRLMAQWADYLNNGSDAVPRAVQA